MMFVTFLLAAMSPAAAQPAPTGVRFEQRIGERLPLDTPFTEAGGAPCRLADVLHGRPAVVSFAYANCPQLCSVVADGITDVIRRLAPSVGREFDVITISIDPQESATDATAQRTLAIRRYGRSGAEQGWHYLRGTPDAIARITTAAGFHYRYDPRSRQYAHPTGFLLVTPDGTISRYFLGVDYSANDLAPALARAAEGKTGQPVFELLLLCFRGDGPGGRYGRIIWRTLGASVALTVLGLAGGIGWMLREERRQQRAGAQPPPAP